MMLSLLRSLKTLGPAPCNDKTAHRGGTQRFDNLETGVFDRPFQMPKTEPADKRRNPDQAHDRDHRRKQKSLQADGRL